MKHALAGWLVVGLVASIGLSAAQAAEQAGQPSKQPAAATGARTTAIPAAQPMGIMPSTQKAAPSPLEGTTWDVKVLPDAMAAQKGEKPFDDSLIFKDGKVTMSACVKMGFAPSTYTTIPTGSAWSFTTHQVSSSQGTTTWTAAVTGDAIKGTMLWTKADGSMLHYTVEGQKAS